MVQHRNTPFVRSILAALLILSGPLHALADEIGDDGERPVTDASLMERYSVENMRVAVKILSETDPENRLIIIGLKGETPNDPYLLNIGTLGFSLMTEDGADADPANAMIPKFLISMNKYGPQKIYAFELKRTPVIDLEPDAGLPPALVNSGSLRVSLLLSDSTKLVLSAVGWVFKNFYVGAAVRLIKLFVGNAEGARIWQASYLNSFFRILLEEKNVTLLQRAFEFGLEGDRARNGMDDATWAAGTLDMRYSLHGKFGGSLARLKDLRAQSDSIQDQTAALSSQNLDFMNNLANTLKVENEQYFYVDRIAPFAALLSYDCRIETDPKFWNWNGFDISAKTKKGLDEYCDPNNWKTPIAIFSLSQKKVFLQLVDFENPHKIRTRNMWQKLQQLVIVSGYFVASPYAIAIRVGSDVVGYFFQRRGSTSTADRRRAYAEVSFGADSGLINIDPANMNRQVFAQQIRESKLLTEEQKATRIAKLNSEDPAAASEVMAEVVGLEARRQEGMLLLNWGGEKGELERRRIRERHKVRFYNWNRRGGPIKLNEDLNKNARSYEERERKHKEKKEKKARERLERELKKQRSPSSVDLVEAPQQDNGRSVILVVASGVRPDWLMNYAKANPGKMKNFIKYFLADGAEFKAFVPYAEALPSWTTILTGVDMDRAGVKFASSATHDPTLRLEDYATLSKDAKFMVMPKQSRVYRRVKSLGIDWLPGLLEKDKAYSGLTPLNDGQAEFPLSQFWQHRNKTASDMAFGSFDQAAAWTMVNAHLAAEKIALDQEGRLRLVVHGMPGIGREAHENFRRVDHAFDTMDESLGVVLQAASEHPRLKDAVLVFVSDHGLSGGKMFADPSRLFLPKNNFELDNTQVNLTKFFAGEPLSKYKFVVGSHKAAEPKTPMTFSSNMIEKLVQGVKNLFDGRNDGFVTYYGRDGDNKGRPEYPQNRTILVDPYGDASALVYMLESAAHPARRVSYHDLRSYTSPSSPGTSAPDMAGLDIVDDLLTLRQTQMDAPPGLKEQFARFHDFRAIAFLAMPLQGNLIKAENAEKDSFDDTVRNDADSLTGGRIGDSTRDPILIQAKTPFGTGRRTALILIKDTMTADGRPETQFRYVVLKEFNQSADRHISLAPCRQSAGDNCSKFDPFYYNHGKLDLDPSAWRTDREWLRVTENEWYPNTVSGLARMLTWSPKASIPASMQYEVPDFAVFANIGYHFNPVQRHQADQGSYSRDSAQTTLFINDRQGGKKIIDEPVLTKDVAPTVMDYLNQNEKASNMDGTSLKKLVETAR